jgi:hypothetical protein
MRVKRFSQDGEQIRLIEITPESRAVDGVVQWLFGMKHSVNMIILKGKIC